jgi:HAD superfamily hydrolase (TIGR01484 family)
MLVVDLDGTLLGRGGEVSARNREAVVRARDAGLDVIVATGRALVESAHLLEAIDHKGMVIAAGGALLCDAATGKTVARSVMPPDVVHEVTQLLVRHGHKVLVLKDAHATGYDYLAVGDGEMDPASKWWFARIPARVRFVGSPEEDPHPEDTVRAGAVVSGAELAAIAAELRERVGDRATLQHWSAVTETHATGAATHLLEVFSARVNKWAMVEAYCGQKGIEREAVVAIGDELNDIEMIRHAGLGIAMGNAISACMDCADRVTGHHDEDGLADAVDHVLAGRW